MIDLLQLYENCVYSSIAHAILVLKEPFFSAEQSWDGMNYSYNSFTGIYGTISFDLAAGIAVGAFRDDHSPYVERYPDFKAIELFAQAPEKVRGFAENEAIQYLFDERDGVTQPMATAAFWCVGGEVTFSGSREEFEANGGEYLFTISVGHEKLRDYWQEQYELSEAELSAVDLIFERFNSHKKITLDDVPVIKQKCVEAPSKKRGLFKKPQEELPNGYEECLTSLGELGIIIE